ncbi:CDP-glucose 4,6-dehydratase [Luminiphilus sp.]|nr:CDP-glucose 4,6-dehydratase [Luminiphilus sp.]
MNQKFWRGKSVFLTGHTGFKGGWLAHWLAEMGAEVHGFSLKPPTDVNFFTEIQLAGRIKNSTMGDIRDLGKIKNALAAAEPEVVFHMAAQPLVRDSYSKPEKTFSTNVMGTVNLLEASCGVGTVKAVVNVTTDKCYDNKEWIWPYRESDPLGGHDPYSASKACAEIVGAAYRRSFLSNANIQLASVRAGNVIGGGDWAMDRLIPDFLRALDAGETLKIRSPNAVRPWQHVLEPLSGYLMLAEQLYEQGEPFADAWNFGPNEEDARSVGWIVTQLCERISGARWESDETKQPHEAGLLKLDSSKAKSQLGWAPRWNLQTALKKTVEWHEAWRSGEDMMAFSSEQIQTYTNA